MNCGCHCCRTYMEDHEYPKHGPEELIRARHLGDGVYYWGKGKSKGRWVRLCLGCQDYLADGYA